MAQCLVPAAPGQEWPGHPTRLLRSVFLFQTAKSEVLNAGDQVARYAAESVQSVELGVRVCQEDPQPLHVSEGWWPHQLGELNLS